MPRTIGIDFGDKRFGFALSDASGLIARPLEVAEGKEKALALLSRLIAEDGAERIVVGLPRNMDGSLGPKAKQVLQFVEDLKARFSVPVATWDERLTSMQAERYLRDSGLSRSKRREGVDKVAAQILLQSWLDSLRQPPIDPEGDGGVNPGSNEAGAGL